jgi:hypothetical protein
MRLFIIYYLCSQQITDAEVEQYSKALEVFHIRNQLKRITLSLDKNLMEDINFVNVFVGNWLRHVGSPIPEAMEDCDQDEQQCSLSNRL